MCQYKKKHTPTLGETLYFYVFLASEKTLAVSKLMNQSRLQITTTWIGWAPGKYNIWLWATVNWSLPPNIKQPPQKHGLAKDWRRCVAYNSVFFFLPGEWNFSPNGLNPMELWNPIQIQWKPCIKTFTKTIEFHWVPMKSSHLRPATCHPIWQDARLIAFRADRAEAVLRAGVVSRQEPPSTWDLSQKLELSNLYIFIYIYIEKEMGNWAEDYRNSSIYIYIIMIWSPMIYIYI